ncbi:helicase-associated domain-containing protein [Rhodococcus sp. G-MC3]|uniref:helicase-associated domain-containing protein n=1 Tax=Rhodococcus sp. G-MC3 TaxID=3046209 RepID=UPI0024BBCA02|nr:helicase-associated domain-containing protein [Rhodococcus sp. G-MC3]MDJ0395093.1 helicase-associated domain-containing protein [Rhodococcus sp. G-MC3]
MARFFDSVADRESAGAATTWRFDRASVRRGFDNGLSAAEVLSDLSKFSTSDVPQALTYLVNDVARTHGSISVVAVSCVVLVDDEALVAEIHANRRASKLGAMILATTVLGFTASPSETMATLRDAGYSPVQRDSDGQFSVARISVADDVDVSPPYHVEHEAPFALRAEHLLSATPPTSTRGALVDLVGGDSHPSHRYTFARGLRCVVAYRGRVFVAHSASKRGEMIQVWNATDGRYEMLVPSDIRVV